MWEVRLDLLGAKSGIELHGNWATKVNGGALITELIAAHTSSSAPAHRHPLPPYSYHRLQ